MKIVTNDQIIYLHPKANSQHQEITNEDWSIIKGIVLWHIM